MGLSFDVAHMLAGLMVLAGLMMLYQDRLYPLLNVLALQAALLALSVAWQAHLQAAPHLYITALIALLFKAAFIPWALRRMVFQLGIHREIERVVGIGPTMLAGIALVALSLEVMLPVTAHADPVARQDIALAGYRQWHQPRGDRRAGNAARSGDQCRVLHPGRLHRYRHFPVPHPRALRHGGRRGA
jgi:hydrogenase-4 component E